MEERDTNIIYNVSVEEAEAAFYLPQITSNILENNSVGMYVYFQ